MFHKNLTSLGPYALCAKIPGVLETCLLEAKSRALHFLLCWSYSFPCGRIEGQGVRWHTVAWSCYIALFAEDFCNVYPSVYTEKRNKKFHVMDQILLGQRGGGSDTSPTTRLIKHGKKQWNSTGMDVEVRGSQWHVSPSEGFKKSHKLCTNQKEVNFHFQPHPSQRWLRDKSTVQVGKHSSAADVL